MVSAMIALYGSASPSRHGCENRVIRPTKARVRFVLDELINTRDLDSVFQIPDQ